MRTVRRAGSTSPSSTFWAATSGGTRWPPGTSRAPITTPTVSQGSSTEVFTVDNNSYIPLCRYRHIADSRNSAAIPTKISKRASTASSYGRPVHYCGSKRSRSVETVGSAAEVAGPVLQVSHWTVLLRAELLCRGPAVSAIWRPAAPASPPTSPSWRPGPAPGRVAPPAAPPPHPDPPRRSCPSTTLGGYLFIGCFIFVGLVFRYFERSLLKSKETTL